MLCARAGMTVLEEVGVPATLRADVSGTTHSSQHLARCGDAPYRPLKWSESRRKQWVDDRRQHVDFAGRQAHHSHHHIRVNDI